MLLLFIVLFLSRQYSTKAAPVVTSFPGPSNDFTPLFIRDEPNDACPGRSVWDIVWSCLATTFAVTWISVHPNVPFLQEKSWSLLKRRVFLMCLALLAPEVMIMWAFKQWRGAVVIKEAYNEARPKTRKPWTMTHAHFVQMGGFKLRSSQRRPGSRNGLYYDYRTTEKNIETWEGIIVLHDVKALLKQGEFEFPEISEDEINDRSKSDAFTKGVALLQITWFITQLIARAHQHLDITEVELTTAALAGLNSIMYLFWWNKPFDVRCPIVLRTKELERRLAEAGEAKASEAGEAGEGTDWTFPHPNSFSLRTYLMSTASGCLRNLTNIIRTQVPECHLQAPIRAHSSQFQELECTVDEKPPINSTIRRILTRAWTSTTSLVSSLFYFPYLLMFLPMEQILSPFPSGFVLHPFPDAKQKMDNTSALDLLLHEGDMSWILWMMFHGEIVDPKPLLIFSALAGAAFGSVHCAAWHFHFLSTTEQVLWRASSLAIVCVCLCVIVGYPFYNAVRYRVSLGGGKSGGLVTILDKWGVAKKILETTPAVIYPLARLCLITLALSSLRDLRGSVLETVKWTEFIPHI